MPFQSNRQLTLITALKGLDHVLIGVRDLEAARAAWTDLGFTLTPRGRHIGWGTANYCIMFEDGYLELLGIVDPNQFTNDLDRFLGEREGLLGLALATEDADAVAREMAAAGLAAEGPKPLERLLELPGGTVRPAFRTLYPAPDVTPGLSAFVCQHLSRELVWQEPWLTHPNGVRGIAGLTALVADPAALAPAYARLFGPDHLTVADQGLDVACGDTLLRLTTSEILARRHPSVRALPVPSLAVLCLRGASDEVISATGVVVAFVAD